MSRQRNGFALVAALMAIVIVTALMLATLLRTDQSSQVARAESLAQRCFAGAERALLEALTETDVSMLRREPLGAIIVSETTLGELTTKVTVIKIDTAVVWLVSDATVRRGRDRAHHRLGLSATLKPDTMDIHMYPVPDHGWVDLL